MRSPRMPAETLRRWAEERYAFDRDSGIFLRRGFASLAYTEGDAAEDALLGIVRGARDCSSLSDELRAAIIDWSTEYHLSPVRANLLRHLPIARGETVLELGAGCGALTRWLGETGAEVVAIEGSRRRAAIARARCRDLGNVTVVCDDIARVDAPPADWVLLVGVLEYANVLGTGEGDGVQALLVHARSRVATHGALVLAIENQLGLKYFNGCAEDHLGIPYAGVEGLYRDGGPVTFGRRILDQRLAAAGFSSREFFFPFPDYKLPLVMLTQQGLDAPELDVADLVARASSRDYGGSTWRAFSESLAWTPLARNGLLAEHANSFLVLAGSSQPVRPRVSGDALAWSYSGARPSRYLVGTTFRRSPTGIVVQKAHLREAREEAGAEFRQQIADAPYVSGRLLSREMLRQAEIGDADALLRCALPWLDRLLAAVTPQQASADADASDATHDLLPAEYVDAIPSNVLLGADGHSHVFDLEWRGSDTVPLEWVLLRGLALALLGIVNSPLAGTVSLVQLAERLLALRGRTLSPNAAEICEAWETRFFAVAVAGGSVVNPPLPAQRLRSPFHGDFDGMAPALARVSAGLHREESEHARLAADVHAVRALLEDERARHEASIAKLRSIDAQAHAAVASLRADVETLRDSLSAEQAMHRQNIERLRDADARAHAAGQELGRMREAVAAIQDQLAATRAAHDANVALLQERDAALARSEAGRVAAEERAAVLQGALDRSQGQRLALEAERAALDGALAAAREEIAPARARIDAQNAELAAARVRIEAQVAELAQLYQERSTFGAKVGRAITRQRNRWLPVNTRRGRVVTLAGQFAVAVAKEGARPALRRAARYLRLRAPVPGRHERTIAPDVVSRAPLPDGGTATPAELARWIVANEPDDAQLASQREQALAWRERPLISIIAPVYKVPTPILRAAIDSLRAQTYEHWEVCVACAEDEDPENWRYLMEAAAQDERVRPVPLRENLGISGNSNVALSEARGEFVALLDHDDALSPSALFAVVARLNEDPALDFLYTDKDSIDESGQHRQNALFKPAFSPEMLHSVNYLTHLNVMRRSLLDAIGGWRPETDGAQDWDLFFRFTERTTKIARVPGLHYHWRIIATSTATGLAAKPYAAAAQLRCQRDRLERLGWNAIAQPDEECGFRILWPAPPGPNVEIVVHASGASPLRQCLDSLRFAKLDDVAAIRVSASPDCPDFAEVTRDFTRIWGSRVRFAQDDRPLAQRLVGCAGEAGPPLLVLIDARVRYVGPNAIEDIARWVGGASPIAFASALLLAPGDVVREAGRVVCEDGTSAPLFRDTPLFSWGWFGGALWHRNVRAASPVLFALRREDLARAVPSGDMPFDRWWMRACRAWCGSDRRGLTVPHARAWLEEDFEPAPPAFDERFRDDPYFHPAFCNVSPLRLTP